MPWHLENKDGKVCVIKDSDGSVAGCHESRTDAIKQQRALYVNESRVAAMYAELDALPEETLDALPEEVYTAQAEIAEAVTQPLMDSTLSPFAAELVGLILKDEREKSLTASLAKSMDAISERMAYEREERGALVAALSQIGQPVIHVAAPEVQVDVEVPTPQVTVEAAQITVQPAEVNVPAPNITVRPEINLPNATKTITFERDFDGRVTKADVVEGGE